MKKLLIQSHYKIKKTALIEDEELIFFDIDLPNTRHYKGNIYVGFITEIRSTLQGVFVKYGKNKEGFLSFSSIHPRYLNISSKIKQQIMHKMKQSFKQKDYYKNIKIQNYININQKLLVQITREDHCHKSAMLSTFISIGDKLSYIPNSIKQSIFLNPSFPIAYKENIKAFINENNITGSFSIQKKISENCITETLNLWRKIENEFHESNTPKLLLDCDNILKTIFLATEQIDEFIIDSKNQNITQDILKYWPNAQIQHKTNIFHNIQDQINDIFLSINQLKNNGYIIWNINAACTTIDVNIGRENKSHYKNNDQSVLEINFEAAQKISRQIQLKNIGGLIVIDFLKMNDLIHKKLIEDYMKNLLENDTVKVSATSINELGVMMISRQYSINTSIKQILQINEQFTFNEDKMFNDLIDNLQLYKNPVIHISHSINNYIKKHSINIPYTIIVDQAFGFTITETKN